MLNKEIRLGSKIDYHAHAEGESPYEKFNGLYPFEGSKSFLLRGKEFF